MITFFLTSKWQTYRIIIYTTLLLIKVGFDVKLTIAMLMLKKTL